MLTPFELEFHVMLSATVSYKINADDAVLFKIIEFCQQMGCYILFKIKYLKYLQFWLWIPVGYRKYQQSNKAKNILCILKIQKY